MKLNLELSDVKLSKVNNVTQVTWEECKETCMDECSEQHFKESVTDIVEHWISECDSAVIECSGKSG